MKILISTLIAGLIVFSSCGSANVKEPEYRDISEVRLIEPGLLQSTAGIDLIFYNPNKFGVQISDARGDVYIDNNYLGRFGLAEKVQVRKKSEFILPAIIKVDMIGALKNQRDIFKKKEAVVRIDGIARVKKAGITRDIPVKFESVQNLERFRNLVAH